jgi:hypothetical protein
MDKSKKNWMKKVGIREVNRPLKYISTETGMMYSEEYIKETPLDELKAKFEKSKDLKSTIKHDEIISGENYEYL